MPTFFCMTTDFEQNAPLHVMRSLMLALTLAVALIAVSGCARPAQEDTDVYRRAALKAATWLQANALERPEGTVWAAPIFGGEQFLQLMERFAEQGPEATLTPHPLFGKLSTKFWGGLIARHIDYHLRQFGA